MDIMLTNEGDLYVSSDGDIRIADSVVQKIKIKLKWFEGEWRWNVDEGMPYFSSLMIKNPDTEFIESIVREKIFEVDEVTEIKDVTIEVDNRTRQAVVRFIALTDSETIKEEVRIQCQIME